MKNLRKIVLASALVMFMFSFLVSAPSAHAAADITILSATVTSASTVVVSFNNPGTSLTTVTAANWHIDVGGGGSTPLTPASAVVTSATAPWTVTLTFAGTPFASTATSYLAPVGLYADTLAVSDGTDTNTVVGHAASIAIADGQKPTFTASRTATNTVVLTFSEAVDAADTATAAWTVADATVTAATDPASSTTLTLTTTGQTSTAGTVAVNYVAGSGTVADAATNEVANGGAVVASDHVRPTLEITISDTNFSPNETALVTFTFSEVPTGFEESDLTVEGGTLGDEDVSDPLIKTAIFTPTAHINAQGNTISVGTGWTDSSAATNAPAGTSTSPEYDIDTRTTSGGGGGGGGGSSSHRTTAVVAVSTSSVNCSAGEMYSSVTGQKCTETSTSVNCPTGYVYDAATGKKCTTWTSTTINPVYVFGTIVVKEGTVGSSCTAWQMFLNDKANAGLVVDGHCGPKSIAAAKKWQASVGLTADGLLGAMSRAKAMLQ